MCCNITGPIRDYVEPCLIRSHQHADRDQHGDDRSDDLSRHSAFSFLDSINQSICHRLQSISWPRSISGPRSCSMLRRFRSHVSRTRSAIRAVSSRICCSTNASALSIKPTRLRSSTSPASTTRPNSTPRSARATLCGPICTPGSRCSEKSSLLRGRRRAPMFCKVFLAQGVVAQQVRLVLRKGKQGRPRLACQNGSPSHSHSLDVCKI